MGEEEKDTGALGDGAVLDKEPWGPSPASPRGGRALHHHQHPKGHAAQGPLPVDWAMGTNNHKSGPW